MNKDFVHLHFHTSYSFLDGYNPISKAISRIKELKMTACAITDHNHLGGTFEFQEECKKQEIKAILGCEVYTTWDIHECSKSIEERQQDAIKKAQESGALAPDFFDKKHKKSDYKKIIEPFMYDNKQYHLILLAMNQTGWNNLVKLQSESAKQCTFNGRFLCDSNLLRKYNEGLICQTACIASASARLVLNNKLDEAEKQILEWKEIFGDRFYLEIQPLNIEQQRIVNKFYMEMCSKHNIEPVATNDVHWTNKEDYDDHDTLLCVGTGKKKIDVDRMRYSNDFWIKSEQEMIDSFKKQTNSLEEDDKCNIKKYEVFYLKAMHNTKHIADRIEDNILLGSGKPLFSNVKIPYKQMSSKEYLTLLAWEGLYKYLKNNPDYNKKEYEERLYEELDVINTKGFAPYFLAVREYINWSVQNNIPVGPGRGSAAGSLVSFCLGITHSIDPIQHKLWFSRFLTKDRTSPPDIDVDFSYLRRDEVVSHLEDYYGKEYVAHIGTYTTMGVKSGLKDVGRVLDIPFTIMNNISKVIDTIKVKAQPSFKDYDVLKDGDANEQNMWEIFNNLEQENKEIFRLARAFEGTPRNFGVHASGILVTPIPISDITPTRVDGNGVTITLYTGPQLEQENLIKYDLLGLKNLDIIQQTLGFISENLSLADLYKKVDLTDKSIYEYIASKETDGVFQLESNLMKNIIDEIQPTDFNDIVAINAIARPGPISIGTDKEYANVKHDLSDKPFYLHGIDNILNETYGSILYQEQLMAISKQIAGFDDNQADSITRKILAKKKAKLFSMLRRCHIYGKRNCEGPEGWEDDNLAPWYDPKGKYGKEIKGALVNGYTAEELNEYFNKIEGFANYVFNKSHSCSYSFISILITWLKKNYPIEFMSALLYMADDDHRKSYINICEQKLGIIIKVPDINLSGENFTPEANKKTILYGLKSIKGVGETSIPHILNNRPFTSLEDAMNRIPKKYFNKRVVLALIKSGSFDFENKNRYALLNKFYDLRKDKDERYNEDEYNKNICIEFEKETIGSPITYKPYWDTITIGDKCKFKAEILSVKEVKDKYNRLMAFVKLKNVKDNSTIDAIVYATQYSKLINRFDVKINKHINVEGKKDNGKKAGETCLIINNAWKII